MLWESHSPASKRRWLSSCIRGGEVYRKPEVRSECLLQVVFILVQCPHRIIHAFSATGLLTQQYLTFCHLARLGVVGKQYIYQACMQLFLCLYVVVYGDLHYLDAVHKEAEHSMLSSVAEVQALPHYAQQGEVQLTEMLP